MCCTLRMPSKKHGQQRCLKFCFGHFQVLLLVCKGRGDITLLRRRTATITTVEIGQLIDSAFDVQQEYIDEIGNSVVDNFPVTYEKKLSFFYKPHKH